MCSHRLYMERVAVQHLDLVLPPMSVHRLSALVPQLPVSIMVQH